MAHTQFKLMNHTQGTTSTQTSSDTSATRVTVYQDGAHLIDSAGKEYDLFDLPADKTFFVQGNLVLDCLDLEQLPEGINRVIVEKDLFIDNNPLTTLKNYPTVQGRTHINPVIRYVENPHSACFTKITDFITDGTIGKLANKKGHFFLGAVDVVFFTPQKRPQINNKHSELLKRCRLNAEILGFNKPKRVYPRRESVDLSSFRYRE